MVNEDFFGGFEAFANTLSNRTVDKKSSTEEDLVDESYIEDKEPEELEKELGSNSPQKNKNTDSSEDEFDNEESGDKDVKNKDVSNKSEEDSSIADLSEAEPEIARYVQDKLAEALGWEFDENTEFKGIGDVVEFLKEVVDINSTPVFANEDVEKLNKFVENGGSIKDFIKTSYGDVDIENVDLSTTSNQKAVIRELLKEKGYAESRIIKSIERYEDAGTLEEEAEDAKELLSELRKENTEKLLKEKEKEKQLLKESQQKYVASVEQTVNTLESVRGIPISNMEKKQLMDYIFKPTADGRTKYQKDYMSSVKNLIESAYFTMKGDAFVQKVQRKANSDAAINLKKKLATSGSKSRTDNNTGFSWGMLSGQLRKPNQK